jgi:dienelactone hydrolase
MSTPLSRRALLTAAALAPVAAAAACGPDTPSSPASSLLIGPLQTQAMILGETAGTHAMEQMLTARDIPVPVHSYNFVCKDRRLVGVDLPTRIKAAVYYPYHTRDHRVPTPNPYDVTSGPFPVVLYAHGVRWQELACATPFPIDRDFTRAETVLRRLASQGCVAVAPDLSWLPGDFEGMVTVGQAFELRARVLAAYHTYLATLNASVFAGQLDLSRVLLVGHSTGAGACALAGPRLLDSGQAHAVAYGFLGPYVGYQTPVPTFGPHTAKSIVVHGDIDTISGGDAAACYSVSGGPKTLVTVPGANHFGYTSLCELDNTCDSTVGADGTISRTGQEQTAAAYLAAVLRFHLLGDATVRPYLNGTRQVEGLDFLGVTGIKIQQAGLEAPVVVHP